MTNTQLLPPFLSYPTEGATVEKLELIGDGVAGAVLQLQSNFTQQGTWHDVGTVEQDGTFCIYLSQSSYLVPKSAKIEVRQKTWWPDETSEPTEIISFEKLLERPVVTEPVAGGPFPLLDQTIKGTGHPVRTRVDIELTRVSPLPTATYKTNVDPDGAGGWEAKPGWALIPGAYTMKAMQTYWHFDGVEHKSNWTDDMALTVA